MMRIGIYCGTFSPPHNGHLAAAKAFMEQMWLDILYVIPTAEPCGQALSSAHRLALCRAAFSELEGVYVSDTELCRSEKRDPIDILRELTRPDCRLFLLCGTDQMLKLDTWREAEELFRLCYPVYVRREDDRTLDDLIIERIADYNRRFGRVVRRIVTEPIELSSESVRELIRNNRDITGLVPPAVKKYIADNHLYG